MNEKIDIAGWKGKDDIIIQDKGNAYIVTEHRKHKETGEVYENIHVIPKINIEKLWAIIQELCTPNVKYGYKFLVRKIVELYSIAEKEEMTIKQMINAFNGGTNRAEYYFPLLYYPLKVLESKGLIKYLGRGGIIKK